jgi:hypothetical protein
MLQILPYLYTLIVLSGGIYLTLLGFKIYKPRMKSPEEQEKMNNWHIKFGTFAKYGGIALTLWGVINLTNSDLNPFNFEKHVVTNSWTQEKKDEMKHQVIQSSNYLQSLHPDTANLIVSCFVEKYTNKFTIEDAKSQEKMNQEQVLELTMPLFKESLDEFGIKTK